MKKTLWRLCNDERGQAMVETALVLPVVLLVICAIFELGWAFSNRLMIANLTREGARCGIVYTSSDTGSAELIRQRILDMTPGYAKDELDINVAYDNDSDYRAGDIIVEIEYKLPTLTPLMGAIYTDGFELKAECTMKMA